MEDMFAARDKSVMCALMRRISIDRGAKNNPRCLGSDGNIRGTTTLRDLDGPYAPKLINANTRRFPLANALLALSVRTSNQARTCNNACRQNHCMEWQHDVPQHP